LFFKRSFEKVFEAILASCHKDIAKTLDQIILDLEAISKFREKYGGDLVFSLKRKNENEVIKLYQMAHSKLPKSLRDKYYEIITGVKIEYKSLVAILRKTKKGLMQELVRLICEQMKNLQEYGGNENGIKIMNEIISAFDKKVSSLFEQQLKLPENDSEEVKEKVKRYYGID
jgi:hypothetical protein